MKLRSLLAPAFVVALAGCGNGAPSITAFTLVVTGKDAAGNIDMQGKITATDPDGDAIKSFQVSASGPAAVPAQSIQVPTGIVTTDLPFTLKLAANAPKGDYTFSVIAYDEPGAPSTAATAKVTLP